MVNKGYRTKKKKKKWKQSIARSWHGLPTTPETRARSLRLWKSEPQTTKRVRGGGDGPRPAPRLRAGQLERRPLPLRPAWPHAPAPRPRHTPAPGPRGHVTRRASPTRARRKHTPSTEGPPGAAALPAPKLRVPPRQSRGSGTFCSFLFRMGWGAGRGEGKGRLEAELKTLSRPPGPPRPAP